MKRLIASLILLMALIVPLAVPAVAQAAEADEPDCNNSSAFLGFPTWYRYLEFEYNEETDDCKVVGPAYEDGENAGNLRWPEVVGRVAIAVVEIGLRFAGIIAVAYVIYGGFRFITSQGDPENAKSARQTIQNALIGLVIALVAIGSVSFIGAQFLS